MERTYYPLTHPQKRIWYVENLYPDTLSHNYLLAIKFKIEIEESVLIDAINWMIKENDALRIRLCNPDGTGKQYITEYEYVEIPVIDFNNPTEDYDEWIEKQAKTPFTLLDSYLYYFAILRLPGNKTEVFIKLHHIIADGFSWGLVFNNIINYTRKNKNITASSYLPFIEHEKRYKSSEKYLVDKKFWNDRIDSIPDLITLKQKKHSSFDIRYERKVYSLSDETTAIVNEFCSNHHTSIFRIFMSLLFVLLHRLTGNDEMIIGTALHNRFEPGYQDVIGMFVSTIPFQMKIDSDLSFLDLIARVRTELKSIIKHQAYPYDELIRDLKERNIINNNTQLYNVMLSYQNAKYDPDLEYLKWFYNGGYDPGLLVFHLSTRSKGGRIRLEIDYDVNILTANDMDQLFEYLVNLLNDCMENPDKKIPELHYLPDRDKQKLLVDFNNTKSEYPADTCIPELFEEQVELNPGKTALVYRETRCSYRELNDDVNSLAYVLTKSGVKPDTGVAILVDRSIEMIKGILGILKAGGAYIPIDPKYPQDRIQFMLKDNEAGILLTKKELVSKVSSFNGKILFLEDDEHYKYDRGNPAHINSPEHLAYVMYTSGSTGKPKGIMVEHKNVVRLVKNTNYITFNKEDRILLTGAVVFDATTFEIWGALLNGLTLYIIDESVILNAVKLEEKIREYGITILWLTSPLFNQLSNENPGMFSGIKNLLVGGDVLSPANINSVRKNCKGIQIINGYGPTENTTFSTCFKINKDYEDNIPIGHPISNSTVYILDKYNKLLPPGMIGELCVGGDGVARGYLNRDELTAVKFVPDPFIDGGHMYKTGDLARWKSDGSVEFLGRKDFQVKIRGFRVELGEIESRILQHNEVSEAVVMVKETEKHEKYLCAYYTSQNHIEVSELRKFLSDDLPQYMIPSYFVELDVMPLTLNGKINTRLLPEPEKDSTVNSDFVAPRTEQEKILVKTWEDVLQVKRIGISDNYFYLGGDSIKAIQVISRLQKYGMTLKIDYLFEYPTVEQLVHYIQYRDKKIRQDIVTGEVVLTPAQRRLFEESFTSCWNLHQSVLLKSSKGFDTGIVKKVFNHLLIHHDILRTTFKKNTKGSITAAIQNNEGTHFDIREYDLLNDTEMSETILKKARLIRESIDAATGPLVKLGLLKTKDADYLLIVIHRLVIDSVSWRILIKDFEHAYTQVLDECKIKLPAKTTSFKEWAEKLKDYAHSSHILHEKNYWKHIANRNILSLPVDSSCPVNKVKDSKEVTITVHEDHTAKLLYDVNKPYNTEIDEILIACLVKTISEWTGKNELLISIEGHERENIISNTDISRTIGRFTTLFPVCIKLDTITDDGEIIKSTKDILRQVPNKGIGYGLLQYFPAKDDEEVRFTGKPQIHFNYSGEFDQDISKNIFEIAEVNINGMNPESERNSRLDIHGMIVHGKLKLSISYNSLEYHTNTIETLISKYRANLISMINHCVGKKEVDLTASDFPGLTISEFNRIKENMREKGIDPSVITNIYSLTPLQEGMLFHDLTDKDSNAYFVQIDFTLTGTIDVDAFKKSIYFLLNKYDVFKTVFVYSKLDIPKQVVLKTSHFPVDLKDISSFQTGRQEDTIIAFLKKDRSLKFDLYNGPLVRFSIFRLADQKFRIIWSFHHIIMDGWCYVNLMKELICDIYPHYKNNIPPGIEQEKAFVEYIIWRENQDKEKCREYWKKYLLGFEEQTSIPKKAQEKDLPYLCHFETLVIKDTILGKIKKIVKDFHVSVNTFFQAAWSIILGRYNNSNDVVFGSVVSGRSVEISNIENMIGLFINTIPVRINFCDNDSFTDIIKVLQNKNLESTKYDYASLAEIQAQSELKQDLLDHILVFENYPLGDAVGNLSDDFKIDDIKMHGQDNYDLSIYIMPGKDATIRFQYNAHLYSPETIIRLKQHFAAIITKLSEHPALHIKDLEILSEDERTELLHTFNNTNCDYAKEKTIHELFEDQAARIPEAAAVIFEQDSLTYKELNNKANHVARLLREKGTDNNTIVGLKVNRSFEMIIGILGILKSGGAYLPLDPHFPEDRIQYMLKKSNVSWLLSSQDVSQNVNGSSKFKGEIIYLDDQKLYQGESSNVKNINTSTDLAYVMFTSGSTGWPKGVMIPHKAVHNFINGITDRIEFNQNKKILNLTTISFDIFVLETLLPLTIGTPLVIANEKQQMDSRLLGELLVRENIDMLQITPSRLQLLISNKENIPYLKKLKEIMIGGEALPVHQLHQLQKWTDASIYNMYGPTETTVWSTIKEVTDDETVTIGTPIANTRIYIVNKSNTLQPVGVTGELCIGGDGLADGYLGEKELTDKQFIPCPFTSGEKMYKTGDLAKWLPDGNLVCLGRIDHQVKVRGFRIELDEIKKAILHYECITDCAVITQDDQLKNKYLVGYYVAKETIASENIREHLSQKLPDYMVPGVLIQLEALPLTPNGKLDRKALPVASDLDSRMSNQHVKPGSKIQETILNIWKELLPANVNSIQNNFFALGGHSLSLVMMYNRIDRIFPGVLNIADIFANPTIYKIAEFIENSRQGNETINIDKLVFPDDYFASPANNNTDRFNFTIDGSLFKNINEVVRENEIEYSDLLLSAYVYILSQVIDDKRIILQTITDVPDEVIPLEVNLTDFHELSTLFKHINQSRKRDNCRKSYSIDCIEEGHIKKEHNEIIPLFSVYNFPGGNSTDNFDIALKYTADPLKLTLECKVNTKRVNSSKVENLIKGYVKILNLIVQDT